MVDKVKNCYKTIFLALIFLMLVIAAISFISAHISASCEKSSQDQIKKDISTLYPIDISYSDYRDEVTNMLHIENVRPNKNHAVKPIGFFSDIISNIEEKIGNYTNSNYIIHKGFFIDGKKLIDKLFGLDMTASSTSGNNSVNASGDVIAVTAENQLGWIVDDASTTECLDNLTAFGLNMQAEGRNFITVINPCKNAESPGFNDCFEKKMQDTENYLKKNGIVYSDAEDYLRSLGLTDKDIFYDTDHHWKTSAAILYCKYLSEYLNTDCGYNIDTSFFDLNNYSVKVYNDAFLGTAGQRVSRVYSKKDDFEIYYPNYDSDLEVKNYDKKSIRTGSIDDTLFDYSVLGKFGDYSRNMYALYGYGEVSLLEIHNKKIHDGSHILMIRNSFADCMCPYFTQACEYLDVIDLRCFNGSLKKYIDATDPDTVISVISIASLKDDDLEGEFFDFR